jgi:hypothetical protein
MNLHSNLHSNLYSNLHSNLHTDTPHSDKDKNPVT